MLRALHAQPDLSEKFTAALLSRNIDLEANLCDQLSHGGIYSRRGSREARYNRLVEACIKDRWLGARVQCLNGTLHAPAKTGVDEPTPPGPPTRPTPTPPPRALWQHAPYFHDGSAATLTDVVAHYNRVRTLGLTTNQKLDLARILKSR